MEKSTHRFAELFAQLGLDDDDESIAAFLASHAPLDAEVLLADAPFWSPSQAAMLKEEIRKDADWAEVIDQLNLALRTTAGTESTI